MSFKRFLVIVIGLIFIFAMFLSPPPAPEPKPAPPSETPKPVIELTPEQKAEQAAKEKRENEESLRNTREALAVRQLRLAMKNPASFSLETAIRTEDGTLCIIYRATNSFNAVVPGRAVITSAQIVTSDETTAFYQCGIDGALTSRAPMRGTCGMLCNGRSTVLQPRAPKSTGSRKAIVGH